MERVLPTQTPARERRAAGQQPGRRLLIAVSPAIAQIFNLKGRHVLHVAYYSAGSAAVRHVSALSADELYRHVY